MPPVEFDFQWGGLKVDNAALDYMMYGVDGEVGSDLRRRGRLVLAAAKRQVGVDTGELRESINMSYHRRALGPEVWVESNNEIALIHHEGSRPHAIVARGPKMLRYSSKGRIAYSRSVQHPGTEPNRYLSDNLYLAGG